MMRKIITKEIFFCCIVFPLCVLYIITQILAGLLIPHYRWKYNVVEIIKCISLHLRCTYYQCFVPWNKERKRMLQLNDWNHLIPAFETLRKYNK